MEIRALLSAMWRNRTGPILVAAQVAITLTVLVNVAYILQQRHAVLSEPTGMDVSNIFWVGSQSYSPEYNHEVAVRADVDYLQRLPGVVAAATTSHIPQGNGSTSFPFSAEEAELEKGGGVPAVVFFGSDKYIETLGLKLVAGRTFDPATVQPPAVDYRVMMGNWGPEVVISKQLADKVFPNGDALGKTLYTGLINKSATVVGIVERLQHQKAMGPLADLFRQVVIVPAWVAAPNAAYLVRAEPGRRDALMAQIEKELPDLQPGRFIQSMATLETTVALSSNNMRASSMTLAVTSVFVLGVTVIGIVGLAAFTVATRTKQLGTRRAIGATKFHILRYFLVENWLITSVGAVLGCALALAVGVKLSLTYQMPRLPLFYLVAGVLLVWIVGMLAVLIPAQRAASISPATATRTV
jgi:putative ABC transport system permease protein